MLSNATKYSVNAVLYLALYATEENKKSIRDISDAIGAPSPFLAKQLQILARNGLVSSTKGPGGGFYLTDENRLHKMIKIVDCIDGMKRLNTCVLGLKACSARKPCPIHESVEPYRKEMLYHLSISSIDQMAKKVKEGKAFLIE